MRIARRSLSAAYSYSAGASVMAFSRLMGPDTVVMIVLSHKSNRPSAPSPMPPTIAATGMFFAAQRFATPTGTLPKRTASRS